MKKRLLILTLLGLAACKPAPLVEHAPSVPLQWSAIGANKLKPPDNQTLKEWWRQFNDPSLTWLIEQTLKNSPDINAAAARIQEARGLQTSSHAELLPKITGVANASRSRQLFYTPLTGNAYDASFDASYELDLFGRNRETARASDAALNAASREYDWVKLSMVAEVSRTYVLLRAAEKQIALAKTNLATEKNIYDLIRRQRQAGGASEFDVERISLQVNRSTAEIADYKRQRETYALSLMTLTGLTAPEINVHLPPSTRIPGLTLKPLTLAPATVLAHRPDIDAANARLAQATSLKNSQAADVFPTVSLSGLFGISKTLLVDTTHIWSIGANAGVTLLDFGRIRGQIDAASAREVQAYEDWRKSVLQAMQDVETSLTNAARIQEQRAALKQANDHAAASVNLARMRFKAGDESLLDVLDAQRVRIEADSALVNAEAAYSTALIALYKSLGQY